MTRERVRGDEFCADKTEDEEIFDVTNMPYSLPAEIHQIPNIIEVRDQLTMRKDNIVVLVDINGKPCDNGARALQSNHTFLDPKDLTFTRGKDTQHGTKNLIAPVKPVKFRENDRIEEEDSK